MREERELVRLTALTQAEWHFAVEWLGDWNQLVDSQDRFKLDKLLPTEFARAALARSKLTFYLGQDRNLRSYSYAPTDKTLTAVEAFDLFGGHAMEEALEFGSFSVAHL